jgi:hypothetical protein
MSGANCVAPEYVPGHRDGAGGRGLPCVTAVAPGGEMLLRETRAATEDKSRGDL